MSINFKKFIKRIGRDTNFKPIKNQLLISLQKDSENKYKNYPRLLELMKKYWPEYKARSRISHLLTDHHEEIFNFYLNTLFPFSKGGLTYEDPRAPTPVDFKLVYSIYFIYMGAKYSETFNRDRYRDSQHKGDRARG